MLRKEFIPIIPMKLQLFADGGEGAGDGAGTGAGTDGNGDGAGVGEGDSGKEGTKTFDDILKDSKYQSEFDKKVAKALETAKAKWETDTQQKIESAKTEAEKLAKMNVDQKAQYEAQKKLEELTGREKSITTRELRAQAYETLAEKGLPKDLIELLNYENAESCNKSIESVSIAFQSAVEKAVNEKLRGGNPPTGNQSTGAQDAGLRRAMGLK